MRTASLLATACLVIAARTAHADDEKSPGAALGLSIGATTAGLLLAGALAGDSEAEPHQMVPAAALLLTGPSWGHVYAGDLGLAIGGTLLRTLGLAMVAEGQGDCIADDENLDAPCVGYENDIPALKYTGMVLVIGTALAEIVDAPYAAKRYNRDLKLSIAPVITSDQVGAMVGGRF